MFDDSENVLCSRNDIPFWSPHRATGMDRRPLSYQHIASPFTISTSSSVVFNYPTSSQPLNIPTWTGASLTASLYDDGDCRADYKWL